MQVMGGVIGYENTHGIAGEKRKKTGTLVSNLGLKITASVAIYQVRINAVD